jgi:hypothetical protein
MAMTGNLIGNWVYWNQTYKQRYGIVYHGDSPTRNNVNVGNVFQALVTANTANLP